MIGDYWEPRVNEYTTTQVREITGWSNNKIAKLADAGTITRTRKGFYTKESVEKYMAERAERLAIGSAVWCNPQHA